MHVRCTKLTWATKLTSNRNLYLPDGNIRIWMLMCRSLMTIINPWRKSPQLLDSISDAGPADVEPLGHINHVGGGSRLNFTGQAHQGLVRERLDMPITAILPLKSMLSLTSLLAFFTVVSLQPTTSTVSLWVQMRFAIIFLMACTSVVFYAESVEGSSKSWNLELSTRNPPKPPKNKAKMVEALKVKVTFCFRTP